MSPMKGEEKASSLFERDLFRGPDCSSLEEEFSEQVVRLVIVVKDHITATDTFNHLFFTKHLLFLSITVSPIGKEVKSRYL